MAVDVNALIAQLPKARIAPTSAQGSQMTPQSGFAAMRMAQGGGQQPPTGTTTTTTTVPQASVGGFQATRQQQTPARTTPTTTMPPVPTGTTTTTVPQGGFAATRAAQSRVATPPTTGAIQQRATETVKVETLPSQNVDLTGQWMPITGDYLNSVAAVVGTEDGYKAWNKIGIEDILDPTIIPNNPNIKKPVIEEYYAQYAPNFSYHSRKGASTFSGQIALAIQNGASLAEINDAIIAAEEADDLGEFTTVDDAFTRAEELYTEYNNAKTGFDKDEDNYKRQTDPYYAAGIPRPEEDYNPYAFNEFKTYSDSQVQLVREAEKKAGRKPKVVTRTVNGKTVREEVWEPSAYEKKLVADMEAEAKKVLRAKGRTPYNDAVLRIKGQALGVFGQ